MKPNWKGFSMIIMTVSFVASLSGCVLMTSDTPHQAFVGSYGWYVGKNVSTINHDFSPKEGFKWFSRRTANGDIEIEIDNALANRQCKIFYTYNPHTKIIVSWRYEGANNQCAINPYT